MKYLIILLVSINYLNLTQSVNQCVEQIHRGCINGYVPTDVEIDQARIYIQNKFLKESAHPPTTAPCPKLYLRRNFKCMSHDERIRVINVIKQLYANGFMWELAQIHEECYVSWHKSIEGYPAHRWLNTQIELAMRKIDPDISLPYWKAGEDCVSPHESLIWEYFGTSGSEETDWCVKDCPFAEQTKERCIKRQWNPDGSISSWYCQPNLNFDLPIKSSPSPYIPYLLWASFGPAIHFHQHINMGGWNGTLTQQVANYDSIFYLFHNFYLDCWIAMWQLSNAANLTPRQYNLFWKFNLTSHKRFRADLTKDRMCHYNTSILEVFHFGFGQQCGINSCVVQFINQDMNKKSTGVIKQPTQVMPIFMRSTILGQLISNWISFQSNIEKALNSSACNPKCNPQPLPSSYTSNPEGRRVLEFFRNDWNFDISLPIMITDFILRMGVQLMNLAGYCSPFVTKSNSIKTIGSSSSWLFKKVIFLKLDKLLNSLLKYIQNNSNFSR